MSSSTTVGRSGAGPRARFLGRLPPSDGQALCALGHEQRYSRCAHLFREGDANDFVVLLRSGLVMLSASSAAGRDLVLAIRGPGDLVGDLAAIDGGRRPHSAQALEPVTGRLISAQQFSDFLAGRPTVTRALLCAMCTRIRDAEYRTMVGQWSTVARVVERLCEAADEFGEPVGDGIRINLPLSQDELASWIGASREALVRALGTLRSRGAIETQRRSITILDRAVLEGAAVE